LETQYASQEKKYDWLKLVIVVVIVATVTSALTIWLMTRYLFPKEFEPVTLNAQEERVLSAKIDRLEEAPRAQKPGREDKTRAAASRENEPNTLEPERYTEDAAKRKVSFSERELNALIAQNTDLAPKLAIDLSDNLASAKLLVPLDPDLPFIGGKTLRVTTGLELRYANQKPIVALKGISIWGVPVPNAWLGGIKNVDLVEEFGTSGGFWKFFAAGVDDIRVEEGQLTIMLKE
jgi:hypothetical protein